MKLSDYVVKFFEKQKIKDIFMVTGGGCMHLVNSFGNSTKIKYWCTEHEQAASMAAEAYSKMKNSMGLVLTTSGPGATNTITGVLDCYQDSTPVVFLSGQSKSKQTVYASGISGLRQFGVQEANIVPIVESITKYAVEIDDPMKIRYHLEKAVHLALSGRHGPVWLSIPLDVQSANVDPDTLKEYSAGNEETFEPSEKELAYCAGKLKHAKRPVIIAGHGVRLSGACDTLSEFALKYKIPVVTPIMGIDVLEGNHECNIGRIGTKGTRAGNFAMQNADLIISLGSRLSVSVVGHEYKMFAREAEVIVVDVDHAEHQKRTIENIDCIVYSDVKKFIEGLDDCVVDIAPFTEWLEICNRWKKKYPVVLKSYDDDINGINYYKFIDLINKHMKADMPVVSDAGSAFYVVAQTINLKKGQRHITTGGTATMGFTLPASIGVAVAKPDSNVIAITGEGSFMQNLQELEVLRYHKMNVKLFVVDNGGYFSIHQTQSRFFAGNYVGESENSGISFTNIAKLADAFGIKYYYLDTIETANSKLEVILSESGPALVEVKVTTDMSIQPTNASQMKPNGVMVSKPLEDMFPFLSREEFLNDMIVEPVKED